MAVASNYLNPTIIGEYGPMKKKWNNSKMKFLKSFSTRQEALNYIIESKK